jgi:hypothetical protein
LDARKNAEVLRKWLRRIQRAKRDVDPLLDFRIELKREIRIWRATQDPFIKTPSG